MENKLRIITSSLDESLKAWDDKSQSLSKHHPLKQLSHLPKIEGITKETARFLKIKSLFYLLTNDHQRVFIRYFFKRPFRYGFNLISSLLLKKSYIRDEDFFFYGIKNQEEFIKLLDDPNHLLVVGFSYCHKPLECPSKRFSDQCIHDPNNPICGQCFIGKTVNHLPSLNIIPLFIPTIHYIGEKMFEITHANPNKKVSFLITACEMTLGMFGDYGNMIGAKGIGVRLDGRICNTMKAFELSEAGIKPGLTVITSATQQRILSLIGLLHSRSDTTYEKV